MSGVATKPRRGEITLTASLTGDSSNLTYALYRGGERLNAVANLQNVSIDSRTLPDGVHLFSLVAEKQGKPLASGVVEVLVDNTPPLIENVQVTGASYVGDAAEVTVQARDLGGLETVTLWLNGETVPLRGRSDQTFSANLLSIPVKSTYRITAVDAAGNEASWPVEGVAELSLRELPTPATLEAVSQDGVRLIWHPVPLPEKAVYTIYRRSGEQTQLVGTSAKPYFVDPSGHPGDRYQVRVRNQDGTEGPTAEVRVPDKPPVVSGAPVDRTDQMSLASVPTVNGGPTTVGGSVRGNTTWGVSGSPYIVTSTVTVPSGSTLTVDPGVVIKFNPNTALIVNGTLQAKGSASSHIVFTSVKDDAHGGDTNGDGAATVAAPGDWYFITPSSRVHAGSEVHTHPHYRNAAPDGRIFEGASKNARPVTPYDVKKLYQHLNN